MCSGGAEGEQLTTRPGSRGDGQRSRERPRKGGNEPWPLRLAVLLPWGSSDALNPYNSHPVPVVLQLELVKKSAWAAPSRATDCVAEKTEIHSRAGLAAGNKRLRCQQG